MVYKTCIVLLSLFLLFFSCKKENLSTNGRNIISGTDSTLIWIKNARNSELPPKERKEWLQMGYENALREINDSLRLNYYSELSISYLLLEDSLNFRKVNSSSRLLAEDLRDSTVLASLYWDLAYFFDTNFVKDSAYYEYNKAEKIYSDLKENYSNGRVLYNMARILKDIKDYSGAEINIIKAIELFLPLENHEQLYLCYNLLGTIAKELKEYEQSREYFTKSGVYLNKFQSKELKEKQQSALDNNIGNSYKDQGDYLNAIPYFKKVLNTDSLRFKSPKTYSIALDNLAYSQFKTGETKISGDLLKKALEINIRENNFPEIAMGHFHLAEYYLAKNDTAQAISNARKALNISQNSNDNGLTLEILKLYPSLDPENAPAYLKEYLVLNDSLQEEERKIRNKFARIRFETDEFIAENELLARQRQLWITIAFGLFSLAILVIVIIFQRVKNQKLRFQQGQQEANQEIFNLMLAQNQKMEEGKQSEQKRISEELHDGILGEMNGIRMVLLGLNKKIDDNAINMRGQAIEKLQEVQEEIRTISHELNDASYQKFHNFIISIEDLLKSICEAADIEYHFNYDEGLDWDALGGDIKINLYRIIQESLQNCIKHAAAKKIYVHMDTTTNTVKVTIKDDGRGFDSKKGKKGIGHKNITSRISKLNGDWSLESTPGKGTIVTLEVPYGFTGSEPKVQLNRKEKFKAAENSSL